MIKFATFLDTNNVLDFVRTFYYQTHYAKAAEFDRESVRVLVEDLIRTGILLVSYHEDQMVGIFGAAIRPNLFNNNTKSCHEVIWYVAPEHQKSGLGLQLIKRADQIRQLRGCTAFQMVRLACSPEYLDKVFAGLGFEPSEYCFTKVN